MFFRSGYERDVRAGDVRRIWVRRAEGRPCGVAHALIPAICLLGRLDAGWWWAAAWRSPVLVCARWLPPSTCPAPPPGIGAATIGPEHRCWLLVSLPWAWAWALPLRCSQPTPRLEGCGWGVGGGEEGVIKEMASLPRPRFASLGSARKI